MAQTRARRHGRREARCMPAVLTWCRQLGSEVKLCTWLSPSRQLRKQCRAAWYSPCCWSCCPSWKRPSLPPFSIPSPSRRPGSLPSELRLPRTNPPLSALLRSSPLAAAAGLGTTGRERLGAASQRSEPGPHTLSHTGSEGSPLEEGGRAAELPSQQVKDRWREAG